MASLYNRRKRIVTAISSEGLVGTVRMKGKKDLIRDRSKGKIHN